MIFFNCFDHTNIEVEHSLKCTQDVDGSSFTSKGLLQKQKHMHTCVHMFYCYTLVSMFSPKWKCPKNFCYKKEKDYLNAA